MKGLHFPACHLHAFFLFSPFFEYLIGPAKISIRITFSYPNCYLYFS